MDQLSQAAISLISRYGGDVVYTSYVPGAYNFDTGTSITTKKEYYTTGVVLDLTLQSNGYSIKYGTLVQSGDKEAYLIPPDGGIIVNPATDTFSMAGKTWKVVSFKEINPTGIAPLVYMLYLRV